PPPTLFPYTTLFRSLISDDTPLLLLASFGAWFLSPAPAAAQGMANAARNGTIHDANVLMGNNLPQGMSRGQFGELMQWGGGHTADRKSTRLNSSHVS